MNFNNLQLTFILIVLFSIHITNNNYFNSQRDIFGEEEINLQQPNTASLQVSSNITLIESNLNFVELHLELFEAEFIDNQLNIINFQLNNAPNGLAIDNCLHLAPTKAIITFLFDGYDFDTDYNNFSITIIEDELNINTNLESNELTIFAVIEANSPPTAQNIIITGEMITGKTVEANYEYFDADGDLEGLSIIIWWKSINQTSEKRIYLSSGLDNFYQLQTSDADYFISVEIIPSAISGIQYGTPQSSSYYGVINNSPPQITEIEIVGNNYAGETICGIYNYFDFDNDQENNSQYQWFRSDDILGTGKTPIQNETNICYSLKTEDIGKYISFGAIPQAAAGTQIGEAVESAYTQAILNSPPKISEVEITGTGELCTAISVSYTYYDFENDTESSTEFTWYRTTSSIFTNEEIIENANNQSYTISIEDTAKYIWCAIIPKAQTGTTTGNTYLANFADPIINTLPTAVFSSNAPICKNQELVLNLHLTGKAPWQIGYKNNNTITSIENIITNEFRIDNQNGGMYELLSLIDGNNCQATELPAPYFVLVHEPPVLIFHINSVYNIEGDPVVLTAKPEGGFFSGPGVIPYSNTFYPAIAGIGGPYAITYSYIDENQCITEETKYTKVEEATAKIIGLEDYYCVDSQTDTLIAINNHGESGTFSGAGIYQIATDTALLIPSEIQAGNNTVTYKYSKEGTIFEVVRTFESIHLPSAQIINLNNSYCEDAEKVELKGTPPNGTFEGHGIENNGTGYIFNPQIANIGINIINYTYVMPNTTCSTSTTNQVTVHPLPVVNFNLNTKYCANESEIIRPHPSGGELIGPNITIYNADSARFDAANLNGTIKIAYYYTNQTTTCSNSIEKSTDIQALPTLGILGLSSPFCLNNGDKLLMGQANSAMANSGEFWGNGITDNGNGTAYFSPSQVQSGGHQISFSYQDEHQCKDTTTSEAIVLNLPIVNLSGFDENDTVFCSNDSSIELVGTPEGGTYHIGQLTGVNIFDPANYLQDTVILIAYETPVIDNCTNIDSTHFVVNSIPTVNFTVESQCIADSILFISESVDTIISYQWNFGDITSPENTSNLQYPKHLYNETGIKTIQLTLENNKNCFNSITKNIRFEAPPEADFIWENECLCEDSVNFISLTTNAKEWKWNFGDGDGSIGFGRNVKHQYTEIGSYNVRLITPTIYNCSDTIIKTIHIRELITNFPYFENLENGHAGWEKTENTGSWEYGTPNKKYINTAFSGEKTWCTGTDSAFFDNENSMLKSPCFNLSSLSKPMIKFKLWHETDYEIDGIRIEYSKDDTNWFILGELSSGLQWYNTIQITAGKERGWSGKSGNWIDCRHNLDMLKNEQKVRFRFVFTSDQFSGTNSNTDGVAIDDIWIGNRSKYSVFEHFTNTGSETCNQAEQIIYQLANDYRNDILNIHYHTNFPAADIFNLNNSEIMAARTLFYGIENVPKSVINGTNFITNYNYSELTNNANMHNILKDAQFSMQVAAKITNNDLEIKIVTTALSDIENLPLCLYTTIIEKEIEINSSTGINKKYKYVIRDILPNAGGIIYNNQWQINESFEENFAYHIKNIYNLEKIIVVAFLQNTVTKEIYQAATSDTTEQIITDIITATTEKKIQISPNPTSNIINIYIQPNFYCEEIAIYNTTGEKIKNYKINKAASSYTINTTELTSGIYFLKITSQFSEVYTEKIIIIH